MPVEPSSLNVPREGAMMSAIKLKKITVSLIVLASIAVFGVNSTHAEAPVVNENLEQDITGSVFPNPCVPEDVVFSGRIHILFFFSLGPSGQAHFHFISNFQDVTGVGQITRNSYRVSNVEKISVETSQPQSEFTFISEMHVISAGRGQNFTVSLVNHVTINGNGEVTAVVEQSRSSCRGQ